jgi:hypothetical protein
MKQSMKASHPRPEHQAAPAGIFRGMQRAPRWRALARVGLLLVLVNPIFTSAFAFLAHQNHPDVALGLTTLFSFALCAIMAVWIRADAKNAWEDARESGWVSPAAIRQGGLVRIARDCPRRWLVVLYVEWQGALAAPAAQ